MAICKLKPVYGYHAPNEQVLIARGKVFFPALCPENFELTAKKSLRSSILELMDFLEFPWGNFLTTLWTLYYINFGVKSKRAESNSCSLPISPEIELTAYE